MLILAKIISGGPDLYLRQEHAGGSVAEKLIQRIRGTSVISDILV